MENISQNEDHQVPRGFNFRKNRVLLIVCIACLIALLTNPNVEQHKSAVKVRTTSFMQEGLKESSTGEKTGFENLGMVFGSIMLNNIIDNYVSTQNLLLCSLTKVTHEGQSRTIGIGIFGNVFLFEDRFNSEEMLNLKND